MMWFNAAGKRKPLFALALTGVILSLLVIMLGAFTRLVDAGLGCPDWPTCYGHVLWPMQEHQIDQANQAYQATPVETDKTWPEQVHRLFASLLGLLALLIFFLSLRHSPDRALNRRLGLLVAGLLTALVAKIAIKVNTEVTAEAMHGLSDIVIGLAVLAGVVLLGLLAARHGPSTGQPLKLPALLVALVILQGLFGMWTVTLKVWPQVVTTHLLGGFATLCLFWLLALRLDNRVWWLPGQQAERLRRLQPWAVLGLVVVVVQIALGGWTTSNYADVACPELPTCQGQWWPPMDFRQGFNVFQHIGPNYLGGQMDNAARVAIHLMHRIGALVTAVYLLGLMAALLQTRIGAVRPITWALGAVLCVQVALGLSNVLFHFPVAVAVAHNAGGVLLLATVLTLLHRLFTVESR